MAKPNKPSKSGGKKLWGDIDITTDFDEGLERADEEDVGIYNREKMILFTANVNYARHLARLSDSLKPVQRRTLFTMYNMGLRPGNKKKSISVVGAVTEWHPHGGASVYDSLVRMGQYWNFQVPLIRMIGSYGTETSTIYAADRYTECHISEYGWNCFFKDYDPECVQMMYSTSANKNEPVSLPSRYPNVIINGGSGIAVGNSFCIPPFNIEEIVTVIKDQLYNPTSGHIYLTPDLPTGCDIVDDGSSIKQICETGKGVLTMRAKTEIIDEGKMWGIRVTNLPWGVTQDSVINDIVKHTKNGGLPVKDIQDRCEQLILEDGKTVVSHVDLWVMVDKAHDPYAVREKLFKKTKLEENASIDFKVVLESLDVDRMSLADLIRSWIDERREYKRRLINKRITKTLARIQLLEILIELCSGANLEKTTHIIKNSSDDELPRRLVKEYGMSSYQANQIAEMKMRAFSKDALKRYREEIKEKKDELEHLYHTIKDEHFIDDMISAELDELKKWYQPRRSQVIHSASGKTMDTETEYFLLATKRGGLKKVSVQSVEQKNRGFGAFENGDYPTHILRVRNVDAILFVDSFGKFSLIQVADIDTMALTDAPAKAFTTTKLEGEIISMLYFQGSETVKWLKKKKLGDMVLITVSRDGYAKRTAIKDLIDWTGDGLKSVKNARLTNLKKNDFLSYANYHLLDSALVFYTRKGEFTYSYAERVPSFGRDAVGNMLIRIDDDDYCVGCSVVNPTSKYVVVVTEKGYVKKCEVSYMGDPSISKETSYLITLDANDGVCYMDAPSKGIDVCTRFGHQEILIDEIPTRTRKAKGAKKIQIPSGDNIIRVVTQ